MTKLENTELEAILRVPLEMVLPSPDNPRHDVGDVTELAASIASVGILEPLIVSPAEDGTYVLVAGERRLVGAKAAGLSEVPVIVRTVSDQERLALAIIENCLRKDLTPLEEAAAYRRLVKEHGYTQRTLAKLVGRNQSHIARRLSLLELPDDVRSRIDAGDITLPDAQALARLAKMPERLKQALKDASAYGATIDGAVRLQLHQHDQELKAKALVKELMESGAPLVEWPGRPWWAVSDQMRPLFNFYGVDRESHPGEPCHRVTVDPERAEAVEVCVEPQRHRPPVTDDRQEQWRAERARNDAQREALAKARDDRLAFLQELLTSRIPRGEVLGQIAWAFVQGTDWTAQVMACQLLGVDTGETEDVMCENLDALLGKGPEEAGRVALAFALAVAEGFINTQWRTEWARVGPHFAFLERHGYPMSDVEREALVTAARQATADDTDDGEGIDDELADHVESEV